VAKTTESGFDAIVIGAGANGLVAACALAKGGQRVLVLERGEHVGGTRRTIDVATGFRAAPLATDAGWVPPAVVRGTGIALPPTTSAALPASVALSGGGFLALPSNAADARTAIGLHSAYDASRWADVTARLSGLSGFLEALYQVPPPDVGTGPSLAELPSLLSIGRRLRSLGKREMSELLRVMPMAVQDLADDELESEPLKALVSAAGIENIRQGPRSGGTSFVLLHHLIGAKTMRGRPWWTPSPDAFIGAAALRAAALGVKFQTGAEAKRIEVRDDAVVGVTLADGEKIATTRVISTAEATQTLISLVDPVWLDPELMHAVRSIKYRGCTAFVLYALDHLPGIPGLDAQALAGVVSLTPNTIALERAYDASKYGAVSERPHIELTAQSLRWPSLAPAGKHVLVARVQYAPYALRDGEWNTKQAATLGDHVTAAIADVIPRFRDAVSARRVLTPVDLEETFGLTEGAVSRGELTLDQILFMRPVAGLGRYTTPIRGLYLGGAANHPGPGIVGGAGWLSARALLKDSR
jgi:phytoene dehydrogenase-like protein